MTDYKKAGVDREAAEQWVDQLKPRLKKNKRSEILSELGGFGAFFEAPQNLHEPVWVATTDGVGTKLLFAEEVGVRAYHGIGQDVVAMCVNDLLACRAQPVGFLDYLATGKLDFRASESLLDGIVTGCEKANCSLMGGETAEMPGFYPKGRLDVAGFAIGVLEKSQCFQPSVAQEGDVVLGLASSGFHSNGFSLIRHIMKKESWSLSTEMEGKSLEEHLLKPTKIYFEDLFHVLQKKGVRSAAHITGGGLIENLPRAIGQAPLKLLLQTQNWDVPPVMRRFQEAGGIAEKELYSTWNMGIGFCLIVEPSLVPELKQNQWIELGVLEPRSEKESFVELL